jgi:nitrilase
MLGFRPSGRTSIGWNKGTYTVVAGLDSIADMPESNPVVRVAAAQHSAVFLDGEASVEKACRLIAEAGANGAELVVLPEAFIPGYPDWVWLVPNSRGAVLNPLYQELLANALTIPDAGTDRLCEAARGAGVHVAVGINERNEDGSGSSLFNALLLISSEGAVLGAHRKLMPTGGERTVWSQGDGSTLATFAMGFGKVGGLLCWENYMPLARQAMYELGTQIHLAPTWDSSESWLVAMRHIAREGGMFVISCCQALRMDEVPRRYEFKTLYPEGREWINKGNSCIVDPLGRFLAGPLEEAQEILYADLDMSLIPQSKRLFDAAGHYSRPDVLRFEFGLRRRRSVRRSG